MFLLLRDLLKGLILVWPFIKNIIFKDRTVWEVLRDNAHLTMLFYLIMIVAMTLYLTATALSNAKVELMAQLEVNAALTTRITELELELTQYKTTSVVDGAGECVPGLYDRSEVLDLLY